MHLNELEVFYRGWKQAELFSACEPVRIERNKDATIVWWRDGTKTMVKRASDEPDSNYAAFTAALAKKIFYTNSAVKRIVARTKVRKPKSAKRKAKGAHE